MNLMMKQRVCCSQWWRMTTTDAIITQMNAFNVGDKQIVEEGVTAEEVSKVEEGTQKT
jgi:hypothetical protein